mmetsp:Transcript_19358/g.29886  ORF Transcript_19358/g.29886 Transcript_19358/m.29886 type:complete len:163 (+) Transcript_19358:129-617(+)
MTIQNNDDLDATSTTTADSSCPGKKGVSFGVIRVREHERILVDGADDDVYACLAIGWGHTRSSHRCLVDEMEEMKSAESTASASSCPSSQRHSASERVKVLNEYGFPLQEVMRHEAKKKKSCALRRACQSACAPRTSSSSSSRRRGGVRGLFTGWGSRKKIC